MNRRTRTYLIPALLTVTTLAVGLSGCTGTADTAEAPAPTASSSPSVTAPVVTATSTAGSASVEEDEAIAAVEGYLTAIQTEAYSDAYALLTTGAKELVGTEQQFAETGLAGIVRADEAAGYLGADGRLEAGPGPVEGSMVVTGVRDRSADAWVVRSTPEGARIDDAGVPLTGQSRYEWVNPASGPEDLRDVVPLDPDAAAAVVFSDPAGASGATGRDLVGYPDELVAFIGTEQTTATPAASELQRRWDIDLGDIDLSTTRPLTVAWAVDGADDVWRSTTAALFVG